MIKSQHLKSSDYVNPDVDRTKFLRSQKLPDFDGASPADLFFLKKEIEITDEMAKQKHPLEYFAEEYRAREDPYTKLQENSLLLTNFPSDISITKEYIKNLCLQKDSTAIINKIDLYKSVVGTTQFNDSKLKSNKMAYAIVEFEENSQLVNVRRGLRKEWIHDRLLKVRTIDDKISENHGLRTVILENIPISLQPHEIAQTLSMFGAITGIEVPKVDYKIKAEVKKKGKDYYSIQRKAKREQEYRLAQQLVQESLQLDDQMENFVNQQNEKSEANQILKNYKNSQKGFESFNLFDKQKFNSFVRILTKLQSEGMSIQKSKSSFKTMKRDIKIKSSPNNIVNQLSSSTESEFNENDHVDIQEIIKGKESQIEKTLKYLLSNQENLDSQQIEFLQQFVNEQENMDPIHKLQRMSLAEITHSYDVLLSILKQRETLIKKRLFETLKHFGDEERILSESHDYSKEQETMPNILLKLFRESSEKIDQYLSVNEQIENVQMFKNLPAEEKLYQWFTGSATFNHEINFNENQLAYANTNQFHNQRELIVPDETQNKSDILQQGRSPRPFLKDKHEEIKNKIQQVRKDTELPYDELYHKEKKLVQDIIKAQKSIQQIEENLPNPAQEYKFNIEDIPEQSAEDGNIYEDFYSRESQFIRDKKNQKREEDQKSLQNPIEADLYEQESQFAYKQQEKLTIDELIEKGQIDRQQYENAQGLQLLNKDINLGYAFITFSHADEATQMIILTQGKLFFNKNLVQVLQKRNLDHSELDKTYFMKKMLNDSQVADQKQELRESNQKLRDFERSIEKELPNQKRLKEFKSIAQEILENPLSKTRRHSSQRRTKREQQELYDKLQDVQKHNPDINLTQLFENEKMDRMRKDLHKRSFINYKKFEFLKAGLYTEDQKKEHKKSEALGRAKENDIYEPYNYPPLQQSVAQILIDGVQAKINISGSQLNKLGRKFEYNEQDFLEAYLGKDYMGKVDLSKDEYIQTFGFHESIKELIPDKAPYFVLPQLEKNKERLIRYFGAKSVDGEYLDPEFIRILNKPGVVDKMTQQIFDEFDVPHYEDKNKTLMGELNKKIKEVQFRAEQNGSRPSVLPLNEVKKVFYETYKQFKNPYIADQKKTQELLEKQTAQLEKTEEFLNNYQKNIDALIDDNGGLVIDQQQQEQINQKIVDFFKNSSTPITIENLQQKKQFSKVDEKQIREEKISEILMNFPEKDRYRIKETLHALEKDIQQNDQLKSPSKNNAQDDYTDDEYYEKKSMFRPFSTKNDKQNQPNQKHDKGQKDSQSNLQTEQQKKEKQIKEKFEQSILEYLPQSLDLNQRNRDTNENLYNIMHSEKVQSLNIEQQDDLSKYDKIAKDLTKHRKLEFERIKKEQLLLDPSKRTPYFIDKDGNLKPYSKEQIEKSKQKKVKIPSDVPSYEQSKQEIPIESVADKDSNKEKAESQYQTSSSKQKYIEQQILEDIEFQEEFERESLFDVINLDVDEAIQEVKISDALKLLKGTINVDESLDSKIGNMHTYQKTFMDEQDLAKHTFRENVGVGRQLHEFIDEKEAKKDIYEQYKEKIQNDQKFQKIHQESLQSKKDAKILNKLYEEAEQTVVKTPDLQNFFQQSSMDKQITDLFNSIDYDNKLEQEEFQRMLDEKEDESKYRKELVARMFGGKLTSRQYAVLMKMSDDAKEQARIQQEDREKNFKQTQNVIRNAEELVEKFRRNMVHTGQWPEQESQQLLQNLFDEIMQKFPTKSSFDIAVRESNQQIQSDMNLQNSESLMEREYYFDEGLGQSLSDHVQNLKTTHPNITIQTRRDRDGLPVVKISMKPQYKYNLDEILSIDPLEIKKIQLDTQETILSIFMPENPKEIIQIIGQLTLNKQFENLNQIYDQYTITKLNKLVKERFSGKYKNDHEQFVTECKLLKKVFETNKKNKKTPLVNDIDDQIFLSQNYNGLLTNNLEKNELKDLVFNDILNDQSRFDIEIQHQLQMKINDKLHFQTRQKSDLVKVQQSETRIFRKQVSRLDETIQILEKDNEWLLNVGQKPQEEQNKDFDREKFNQLKSEIKRRKEAKQKILNQGFPEFQSYSRL